MQVRHSSSGVTSGDEFNSPTLMGHPVGLFTLFFAEMWERFSYYGMRALLVLYMMKGFLKYGDAQAYTVYGAYTSLVYMTPFFGGLLADRLLGSRRAVILGGLLMAAGQLLLTVESQWSFFFALALLITGNGFFKPNISTMVGSLYPAGSKRRDAGFTIFYMGINLGAALSPLICGYIGEVHGWHYGFGMAAIGMLIGLSVFAMPNWIARLCVMLTAVVLSIWLAAAAGMIGGFGKQLPFEQSWAHALMGTLLLMAGFSALAPNIAGQAFVLLAALWAATLLCVFKPENNVAMAINYALAAFLVVAAIAACVAMTKGRLPEQTGQPPGGIIDKQKEWTVYVGALCCVPIFALLVSGFSPFRQDGQSLQLISAETVKQISGSLGSFASVGEILLSEVSKPAGLVLTLIGFLAFGYLIVETFRLSVVPRQRMIVALTLIFFQMLFFAFFEQAGSSINNFTDRNVDRVGESEVVTQAMVGQTIQLQPTQEQLGYVFEGQPFSISKLDELRAKSEANPNFEIAWTVTAEHVGMGLASRSSELPATVFQSVNPVFILIFGLAFTALWSFLGQRGVDPPAPVKFGLGLLQIGLGFGAFWYGAIVASDRGMVSLLWLVLGYLLQTTGELCLSPVGLSTMTKLSPKFLVSTVMGAWFLATAFSQYLAAIISQFTGVSHGGAEGNLIPPPSETVHVYGGVFGQIAIAAVVSGAICLILSPVLSRWMHEDRMGHEE